MLNFNEYQKLSELIKSNPELEPIINNMSLVSLSELSIDSHDIKNYIAYLKTTFQLVRKNLLKYVIIRISTVWKKLFHNLYIIWKEQLYTDTA